MKKGFTLIEVLVVISIISFTSSIVFASLQESRVRAVDVATKESLAGVRSTIETSTMGTTAKNYTGVFSSGEAVASITTLAQKLNLVASEYQYISSASEYAVIFPLKSEVGYWCIDSIGNSKKVPGLLNPAGALNCGQAGAPQIVLFAIAGQPTAYYYVQGCNQPNYENYSEPGFTAVDSKGNDITYLVVVGPVEADSPNAPITFDGPPIPGHKDYTVTDPTTQITTTVTRSINIYHQMQECAAPVGGVDVDLPLAP